MKSAMGLRIVLFVLCIQSVRNDIFALKNESSCLEGKCTTLGVDLLGERLEYTTDNDKESKFATEEEVERENQESLKSGFAPKLKSLSVILKDKFHTVELVNPESPEPETLMINSTIEMDDNSFTKKDKLSDEKLEELSMYETKTENPVTESTTNSKNDTKTNTTKEIHHKHHYERRNESIICTCDLKAKECDINCCCDRDCSANVKTVFTKCVDTVGKVSSQFCFNSRSIFKNNLDNYANYRGLLCVVRTNLRPHVEFKDEMVIKNVTEFKKLISRKKLFTYSPLQLDHPKLQKIPYRFGDYIWGFSNNKTFPFGVPKQTISMQCQSTVNIHYLLDYETQCLQSVPHNKENCMTATYLEMDYYLRGIQLIRSPTLIKSTNSSDKVCSNTTCVQIIPYICVDDTDLTSCIKSAPRRLLWDNICKNIVVSVEYHVYHNGTDGIREARAYFTLGSLQKDSFIQKIKLRFLWVKAQTEVLRRSGNPGYITGKPIMSGRKIYSSNETTSLRKEAIELSYNPEDWLTVVGSRGGICSPNTRRPIGFGENARHTCFVDLEHDYFKRKCVDLQDALFNTLLGEDFGDIKLDNKLNKFVATFGNSNVEDTGDWVQVIIDVLPMVSSLVSFTSSSDFIMCKNVINDLFIDIAYSKIGSFDKAQNKILGVHMYFGSHKDFVYYINPNSSSYGSNQKLKLSTYVNFIDLTREPVEEFAETPGFEAKLPHDFFYPFFSRGCVSSVHFFLVFICVCSSFLRVSVFGTV